MHVIEVPNEESIPSRRLGTPREPALECNGHGPSVSLWEVVFKWSPTRYNILPLHRHRDLIFTFFKVCDDGLPCVFPCHVGAFHWSFDPRLNKQGHSDESFYIQRGNR